MNTLRVSAIRTASLAGLIGILGVVSLVIIFAEAALMLQFTARVVMRWADRTSTRLMVAYERTR